MDWFILVIAGLLEVAWAIGMKYTHGFTRLVPSVLTLVGIVLSMGLLAWSLRTIPVGTAYAVWTGIGALGTCLMGMWLFAEPVTPWRIAFLAMILGGIVGLKVTAR